MRIETIKYFLEIADSGSIRMTAQNHFISQQGLSDAIKKMEEELGTQLLIRSKRGVTLSSEGTEVYKYFKKITESYDDMQKYLWITYQEKLNKEKQSLIRLQVNPLSMSALVPALFTHIENCHANIQLLCRDTASLNEMEEEVKNNKVDFALFLVMQNDIDTIIKKREKDLEYCFLFSDEVVACVNKDSELAKHDDISLDEFNALEKVLSDSSYISEQTCFVEHISNNVEVQLKLIQTRNVVAVTNQHFFAYTFPENIVQPIPFRPPLRLQYYLMYSPFIDLDYGKMQFLQILADCIEEYCGQKFNYSKLLTNTRTTSPR